MLLIRSLLRLLLLLRRRSSVPVWLGGILLILMGYLFFFYTQVPITRVVIDPGHGGINPVVDGQTLRSERWDEPTHSYLSFYSEGMAALGVREADVMYPLAERVQQILQWTQQPFGWLRFKKLLRAISDQQEFPRILFHSILPRPANHPAASPAYPKAGLGLSALMSANRESPKIASPLWAPFFAAGSYLNDLYRLYDFRDMRGRRRLGRFSNINAFAPSLVVSLHMTPGGKGTGGMSAVLTPGFSTLNMVREIHLNQRPYQEWQRSPWQPYILQTRAAAAARQSKYQTFRSDIWGYFHGYRALGNGRALNFAEPRGLRHHLVTWAYNDRDWFDSYDTQLPEYHLEYDKFQLPAAADPDGDGDAVDAAADGVDAVGADGAAAVADAAVFWQRERGLAEEWRREGGALGFGGDNHFASDELLRFIREGSLLAWDRSRARETARLRRGWRASGDAASSGAGSTATGGSSSGAASSGAGVGSADFSNFWGYPPGEIYAPYVSTYALPIYVNAVVAYLEIGSLDVLRDRNFVLANQEVIAQAIAVGIYSLYQGLAIGNGGGGVGASASGSSGKTETETERAGSGAPVAAERRVCSILPQGAAGTQDAQGIAGFKTQSCAPRGEPLNFSKYQQLQEPHTRKIENYFEQARP